ncbi:MAG: MFS transporter [Gordonibacter pamelaeae]
MLALVSFVVFALFVSVPHAGRGVAAKRERETGEKQHRPAAILLEGFKVKRMWLFGLGFCFLMFTSLSVLTWVPTYVQGVELERMLAEGMDLAAAQAQAGVSGGSMASLGFAASIPMALVTAFLLGKFQTLKARNVMVIIAGFCAFFYVGAFLGSLRVPARLSGAAGPRERLDERRGVVDGARDHAQARHHAGGHGHHHLLPGHLEPSVHAGGGLYHRRGPGMGERGAALRGHGGRGHGAVDRLRGHEAAGVRGRRGCRAGYSTLGRVRWAKDARRPRKPSPQEGCEGHPSCAWP